jgi:hypothetical protein
MNLATHLLANREAISLQAARVYLGSRVLVRTPLGASQFLAVRFGDPKEDAAEMREAWDARVKVALDCDEIYRVAFPDEYRKTSSPYLSLQREQELYQLIHTRLFPLLRDDEEHQPISRWQLQRFIEVNPHFFLEYIPLRGAQRHIWNPRFTEFEEINLAYQVAWALSREFFYSDDPPAWQQLNELHGLDFPEPALPLASVGWTELLHTCAVEQTPLRFLPLTFQAISYKTGNRFLDLPQIGAMGFDWGLREIIDMHLGWSNALDIMQAIDALARWLEEDPKVRVGRVYEIWNRAAAIESESPFAGMLAPDLIEAGGIPMGGENVLLTRALVNGVTQMVEDARA